MKKILALSIAAVLFCTSVSAQDPAPATVLINPAVSTSVDGARYEIINSGRADSKFLRLDKVDGTVWEFYGYGYHTVIKREAADQDTVVDGQVNYQLYISGDGANTYLLNLNTGIIWYYDWHLFKDNEFLLMK